EVYSGTYRPSRRAQSLRALLLRRNSPRSRCEKGSPHLLQADEPTWFFQRPAAPRISSRGCASAQWPVAMPRKGQPNEIDQYSLQFFADASALREEIRTSLE